MAVNIHFVTFRRAFLGLVAFISFLCLALAMCIQSLFYGNHAAVVLVVLPVWIALTSIISAIRKPLCQSPQPVVHEVISSAILSLMQLALCSVFTVLSTTIDHHISRALTLLQVLIYINSGLVATYTFTITLAAIITLETVDPQIRLRDIESVPCPLPFHRIFSYTPPSRKKSAPPGSHSQICLPGCACSRKISPEGLLPPSPVHIPQTQESSSGWFGRHSRWQGIVRMPTALERSASIHIALH